MATKHLWVTDRFYGGLSEAQKEGPKGSFLYGNRLDIKSDLTSLTAGVKTTNDGASTITDLPKWIERDAVNDRVYAYGNDGNFYRENAGTWSALTTPTSAAGQGMRVWNDYVYLRKTSALARYGLLSGTPTLTQNWQTANVQTENDHGPIQDFLGNLYFANGRFLGEWDGTTWTYNKLTLPIGWKIRAMAVLGEELWMGGWQGSNIYDAKKGYLWSWNGTDTSVTNFLEIGEGAINAMYVKDNNLYFVAGSVGNLYVYTGQVIKLRQLSNLLGVNQYLEVFPGAMTIHKGDLMVGVAGNTDSGDLVQGVYSYGRMSKNYPVVLNIDHIASTGTITGTTLKIGAVHSAGPNEFYVGIEDTAATNRIDRVSGTSPYTTARWESLWFDNGAAYAIKEVDQIKFTYKPLATNETLDFYYRLDRAASWTSLGTAASTDAVTTEAIYSITPLLTWKEIQLAVDIKTSGTTSPDLLSSLVSFSQRRGLKR